MSEQLWTDQVCRPGQQLLDGLRQVYFTNPWAFVVRVVVTIEGPPERDAYVPQHMAPARARLPEQVASSPPGQA
jgi:hypothetical protein